MIKRRTSIFVSFFSALLLLIPTVSAQTSTIIPGAITVLGEGTASVPAETATVVITIGGDSSGYYYEEIPSVEPVTPATEPVDVQPIYDAIVAFGVPVNDIETIESPFQGEWGQGMPPTPTTIVVSITQPTTDGLSELLQVVRTSASEHTLYVNQFGVIYEVADCRAVFREARADAFANAQMAAEDQAAAMNTTVGDPIASQDTYPMTMGAYQSNSCSPSGMMTPYDALYMAGQFNPSLPAEVTVWVAVQVSFEIP